MNAARASVPRTAERAPPSPPLLLWLIQVLANPFGDPPGLRLRCVRWIRAPRLVVPRLGLGFLKLLVALPHVLKFLVMNLQLLHLFVELGLLFGYAGKTGRERAERDPARWTLRDLLVRPPALPRRLGVRRRNSHVQLWRHGLLDDGDGITGLGGGSRRQPKGEGLGALLGRTSPPHRVLGLELSQRKPHRSVKANKCLSIRLHRTHVRKYKVTQGKGTIMPPCFLPARPLVRHR